MKLSSVLFVCTGNICRSPTAEGIFRHHIHRFNPGWSGKIDSAGTHDYHEGEPPDPRSIAHASARGISIAALRARKVTSMDFKSFTSILAMDQGHYEILLNMKPAAAPCRVERLLDYAPDLDLRDVPDPYYGQSEDFSRCFDIIEAGILGFIRSGVLSRSGA